MKQLFVMLLFLCSAVANAQDVIVKRDGSTILSKVLEVGEEDVKYKKSDNLDGPIYTIKKTELQAINYKNGAKDTFSEPVRENNRYLPNNQNDGTQQYNDRALLEMDAMERKSINLQWRIKAGYSIDNYTDIDEKAESGFDGEIGVLLPFRNSNFTFGFDLFFASIDSKGDLTHGYCLGGSPYIGYRFPIMNRKMSLMLYVGPYVGNRISKNHSNIKRGFACGANIGLDFFLSENFFVNFHFKHGFNTCKNDKFDLYDKNYKPVKYVIGIGYKF